MNWGINGFSSIVGSKRGDRRGKKTLRSHSAWLIIQFGDASLQNSGAVSSRTSANYEFDQSTYLHKPGDAWE